MMIDQFSDLTDSQLASQYAWTQEVRSRVNLVIDSQGLLAGPDGTSQSLTSKNDRTLLHRIRRGADAVVVGANSVRKEGWHIPSESALVVISHGTLDELPFCPAPERVHVFGFTGAVEYLESVENWVCEGGQTVVQTMLTLDLVDELCLTFLDSLTQELPAWITQSSHKRFVQVSAIQDGRHVFTRWRRG